MDGYEATRRLRADPRTAGLPIIALTAGALEEDKGLALEAAA
jgi:CheY-like chemotaxis protein